MRTRLPPRPGPGGPGRWTPTLRPALPTRSSQRPRPARPGRADGVPSMPMRRAPHRTRGRRAPLVYSCLLTVLGAGAAAAAGPGPKVDFNRDIRPILADKCFACHGPDEPKRKAKLRLDTADGALGEAASGSRAVVPGKPEESELYLRITSDDPEERMPPAEAKKPLTPAEVE